MAESSAQQKSDPHGWRKEGKDLTAAVAGGSIVGMPLLYTMEMWFRGMMLPEWHLGAILALTLVVTFLCSLESGFRNEDTLLGTVMEAVTSVGIGIVLSAAILTLVGEITLDSAPREVVGKVLLQAAAVSLGVAFANAQVRDKSRTGDDQQDEKAPEGDPEALQLRADLRDFSAAAAGSLLFTLNIASTEEVVMIASRLSPWRQLAMLGVSVALCYVILFASGFEKHEVYVKSVFQSRAFETLMTCAVSLLVATALLCLIGERETTGDLPTLVASVVTLGLPAIVGGAAGRLVV
ncbi:TIGR02587 family membrane protein [Sorangium sp. So ce131]|uniref:TIGR02587 family membrane protein n=1 Tax=Sorangium sp. So ce131 TaxID=3133282 RepID=UPI003F5F3E86